MTIIYNDGLQMIISICWISDDHFYHVSIFFASSLLISAAFSKGFPLCQDPKAATVVVARSFLPMLPGGGPFQSPLYRLKPWGVKSPWKNFTISSLNTVPWSLGRCFFFFGHPGKTKTSLEDSRNTSHQDPPRHVVARNQEIFSKYIRIEMGLDRICYVCCTWNICWIRDMRDVHEWYNPVAFGSQITRFSEPTLDLFGSCSCILVDCPISNTHCIIKFFPISTKSSKTAFKQKLQRSITSGEKKKTLKITKQSEQIQWMPIFSEQISLGGSPPAPVNRLL